MCFTKKNRSEICPAFVAKDVLASTQVGGTKRFAVIRNILDTYQARWKKNSKKSA